MPADGSPAHKKLLLLCEITVAGVFYLGYLRSGFPGFAVSFLFLEKNDTAWDDHSSGEQRHKTCFRKAFDPCSGNQISRKVDDRMKDDSRNDASGLMSESTEQISDGRGIDELDQISVIQPEYYCLKEDGPAVTEDRKSVV